MDKDNYLSQESSQNNFNFKNLFSIKNIAIFFVVLITLNLIYIDLLTLNNPKPTVSEKVIKITKPSDPSESRTVNLIDQLCPQSCIAQIHEATASYKPNLPIATPTIDSPTPAIQTVSLVKEYFIPFGSGSSTSDDWQDVAGIQASVDTNNYPAIKNVTFEASVRIPTGNEIAYIRLYNLTDKHPVWSSEVSVEGGTAKLLISKPISLDSGSKLYQVQMKTSLKYQAIFDQARLRIITY